MFVIWALGASRASLLAMDLRASKTRKNMCFSRHTGLKSAQKHTKTRVFRFEATVASEAPGKTKKHVKTRVFPLRRLS